MVRSFLEPWDLYTLRASKMTLTGRNVVQNLAGAVLKFQLKTVLTHPICLPNETRGLLKVRFLLEF
jgi:hypothetical protein